jgi:hypothetical protein
MPVQSLLVIGIATVLVAIALWRGVSAWLKFRGRRVVSCPENQRPAGVTVNASHVAMTALGGTPDLQLSSCSRWPERAGCGQQCLSQIHSAGSACLVRNILERWYSGKVCASCGRPFGAIQWSEAKPALLTADKKALEWDAVPAEQLQETLLAAVPVCFACHMASKLVREHPDLAIDRGLRS